MLETPTARVIINQPTINQPATYQSGNNQSANKQSANKQSGNKQSGNNLLKNTGPDTLEDRFDPYESWLGLNLSGPPTHYELLGLTNFESDSATISQAVDRQAAILQMVTGPQQDLANSILAEIGQARICLLDPKKKSEYDQQIRQADSKPNAKRDNAAEQINAEQINAEQINAEQINAEQINAEQINAEQINAEQINAEQIIVNTKESDSPKNAPPNIPDPNPTEGLPAIKSSTSEGTPTQAKAAGSPTIREVSTTEQNPASENLSGLESDLHSRRVESQKAKEAKDQQFKVIMDRLLWASCGVALVAIIWVMIVRTSGCSQNPVQVVTDGSNESGVKSKKLTPQKDIDLSLKSPLEKTAKELLRKQEQEKENKTRIAQNKKNQVQKSSSKSSVVNQPNTTIAFQPIDQTIGFFDFNQPVNRNDRLDGLAPLRLKNTNWTKQGKGGFISLSKASRLTIDREDAFDTVKSLTVICKFKCSRAKQIRYLVSLKEQLVIGIEQGKLRIGQAGNFKSGTAGKNLDDGKWHRLAVMLDGKFATVWLDGKSEWAAEYPFPDFKSSKADSTIGNLNGIDSVGKHKLVPYEGSIDNLGFYWTKLTDSQIHSQFAN